MNTTVTLADGTTVEHPNTVPSVNPTTRHLALLLDQDGKANVIQLAGYGADEYTSVEFVDEDLELPAAANPLPVGEPFVDPGDFTIGS